MNYEETIHYLFSTLPMFSNVGAAAYKADLNNTIKLCQALGNPNEKFRTIHIAGTNGKGSTSHTMAAILQTAGYKTGLYTSPHLYDFRERIKVNGAMCDKKFVTQFVEQLMPLIHTIKPSFFEITVAMAFVFFAQQNVDVAVIEVGLGGRLDSTNIITPVLSIITNIGYDHIQILGNTLQQIATEKAGIIKHKIPIVIGESLPETKPIFQNTADTMQAPIVFAQDNYQVTTAQYNHDYLRVAVTNVGAKQTQGYILDLTGVYQTKNIITTLAAVEQLNLQGWDISNNVVSNAVQNVKLLTGLRGRWEVLQQNPLLVVDVAHNEDGIKELVRQLQLVTYKQLHIVIGMVKDKDIAKALALLPTTAQYYFTKADIPRALDEKKLQQQAGLMSLQGVAFPSVSAALQSALRNASKEDMVVVCGSVFVVAEVVG